MKKVLISLINYNAAATTVECLASLEKLEKKNIDLHVRVIDNNSKEKFTVASTRYSHFVLTVDMNNKNLGFSGGHNKNIEYARSIGMEYVLILNNDTVVDPSMLVSLLEVFNTHDTVGVAVPMIYFFPGDEYHKDRYTKKEEGRVIWYAGGQVDWKNVLASHKHVDEVDNGNFSKVSSTEYATGACMLLDMNVLQKVGMFDERYFLYYEDCDLSMRIKKAGHTILFNPEAKVWHRNAKSTGGSGSELQDYFITRNRLIFGFRYAPVRSRMALVRESISLSKNGRLWQKRGIKDFFMRKFGKGTYPVGK